LIGKNIKQLINATDTVLTLEKYTVPKVNYALCILSHNKDKLPVIDFTTQGEKK